MLRNSIPLFPFSLSYLSPSEILKSVLFADNDREKELDSSLYCEALKEKKKRGGDKIHFLFAVINKISKCHKKTALTQTRCLMSVNQRHRRKLEMIISVNRPQRKTWKILSFKSQKDAKLLYLV